MGGNCKPYCLSSNYEYTMANRTSPTPIITLEEQLRSLYVRRSVIDRLIRTMETYQRLTRVREIKKHRVA